MIIEKLQIHLPKSTLTNNSCLVGIDFGRELIKVSYVSKKEYNKENLQVNVNFLLFHRNDLQHAIQDVADNAVLGDEDADSEMKVLNVTGTVTKEIEEIVKSVLNVQLNTINDIHAHVRGNHVMLRDCSDEEILFPPHSPIHTYGKVELFEISTRIMRQMKQEFNPDQYATTRYPCLLANIGSWPSYIRINEDGTHQILFVSSVGAATYNYLSKLFIGTEDFNEIGKAAAKGDRRLTDTQTCDVLSPDIECPFGILDQDVPFFPFGKLAEDKELHKNEDLVHALTALGGTTWFCELFESAYTGQVSLAFVGGSLLRDKVIREEIHYGTQFWGMEMLQHRYYQTGMYAAALGCLLWK